MKKISQSVVEAVPFPANLSVDQQTTIVSKLDALQEKLDAAARLAHRTSLHRDSTHPGEYILARSHPAVLPPENGLGHEPHEVMLVSRPC